MDFRGKVALVTGATTGIGASVAMALARAGAAVVGSGRNRQGGEAVGAEIAKAGGQFAFLPADFTDPAACERLVADTLGRFGRLDLLVNNAGVNHAGGTLDLEPAKWLETMMVNVNALFFMTQAAGRAMKANGGAIVNISSQLGLYAHPGTVSYATSKAAIIQMTRAVALDLAPYGIRVNTVAPGVTLTEMLKRNFARHGETVERGLARVGGRTPLKRVATVEEVTDAVLFLLSDDASYVTGARLSVDGGNSAAGPGAGRENVPASRPAAAD